MTRAERRYRRQQHLDKRERLLKSLGPQGGTLYEKHRAKVSISLGYMSKGNVRHYVATHPRRYYKRGEGL